MTKRQRHREGASPASVLPLVHLHLLESELSRVDAGQDFNPPPLNPQSFIQVLALSIVHLYLTESEISPLHREFVEGCDSDEPVDTYIYIYIMYMFMYIHMYVHIHVFIHIYII